MPISTETDNQKYRNHCNLKSTLFKKIGLKFRNPKFNNLCKIAFFFFLQMPTLYSLELNKATLEQVKVTE